jgi:hypothetical protein
VGNAIVPMSCARGTPARDAVAVPDIADGAGLARVRILGSALTAHRRRPGADWVRSQIGPFGDSSTRENRADGATSATLVS